jgi:hypothetical protein
MPSVAEETSQEKLLVGSSNVTCYEANWYQALSIPECAFIM